MVIEGKWALFDDSELRPVLQGEILNGNGSWQPAIFLVDTGADKSVFSADVLRILNLPFLSPDVGISGVGNDAIDSVLVETTIRFPNTSNRQINFNGRFNAVIALEALDFCVLGRDILKHFAVIVDQPDKIVALVSQSHIYQIKSK